VLGSLLVSRLPGISRSGTTIQALIKKLELCFLPRISHGPVRNAHGVPTFVRVSRESIRPGPERLSGRPVTLSQIEKFVRRSG
jgi:hypothetical protein